MFRILNFCFNEMEEEENQRESKEENPDLLPNPDPND